MQNIRINAKFKRQTDRLKATALFLVALAVILATLTSHADTGAAVGDLRLMSQFDAVSGDYRLSSSEAARSGRTGIRLQYSSKSRHRGLFGWGWCSDLDAEIKKSESGVYTYRGCEFPSADIADPRDTNGNMRVLPGGRIQRTRGDGVEQTFDSDGALVSLKSPSGEIATISRTDTVILFQAARTYKVSVDREHRLAKEIEEIGRDRESIRSWSLKFDGVFLARLGGETYQYDAYRRMIRRERATVTGGLERELVGYRADDGGIGRFERQAASPENRLLVTVRVSEESGKIEIKAERGAEMHPVRIFYDMHLKTLELFGDRQTARSLLRHLMS